MRFCWHKWSLWSAAIKDYNGNWHQVCKCEKCGAIARRSAISMFAAHITVGVNEAIAALEKQP